MNFGDIAPHLGMAIAACFALGAGGIYASFLTTRMKIRNGYPLEGMWGQSLKPSADRDTVARVNLLTQENAQLKAEVAAMRERVETVERIVTDSGYQLTHDIERLRLGKENVQ